MPTLELNVVSPVLDPSGYAEIARQICYHLYFRGVNIKIGNIRNWDKSVLNVNDEMKSIIYEQINSHLISKASLLNIAIPDVGFVIINL